MENLLDIINLYIFSYREYRGLARLLVEIGFPSVLLLHLVLVIIIILGAVHYDSKSWGFQDVLKRMRGVRTPLIALSAIVSIWLTFLD